MTEQQLTEHYEPTKKSIKIIIKQVEHLLEQNAADDEELVVSGARRGERGHPVRHRRVLDHLRWEHLPELIGRRRAPVRAAAGE